MYGSGAKTGMVKDIMKHEEGQALQLIQRDQKRALPACIAAAAGSTMPGLAALLAATTGIRRIATAISASASSAVWRWVLSSLAYEHGSEHCDVAAEEARDAASVAAE